MRVAVEGCCHGELDKIYETLAEAVQQGGKPVDLLLCCGDFQAVRNESDLLCMAVPPKYRHMQDFHRYYSGEKQAPVLTVFIGGNHEASNHLQELPFGGWVAPNIYYMGYAGVLCVGGIRIAGLSGIYKGHDYYKGHFECPPYSQDCLRSAYHVRSLDVYRLMQLSNPPDVFLSHDWPLGVTVGSGVAGLLRRKPFFAQEVEGGRLGSPPAGALLRKLQPSYWFSAHLHVKYATIVQHQLEEGQKSPQVTKFLALDKCLPRREFLQVLELGLSLNSPPKLEYDEEWLAIMQATDHLTCASPHNQLLPDSVVKLCADDLSRVRDLLSGDLAVPTSFSPTVPFYSPKNIVGGKIKPPVPVPSPQTATYCRRLGLTDVFTLAAARAGHGLAKASNSSLIVNLSSADLSGNSSLNPDEILLDDDVDGDETAADEEIDGICLADTSDSALNILPSPMPLHNSTPSEVFSSFLSPAPSSFLDDSVQSDNAFSSCCSPVSRDLGETEDSMESEEPDQTKSSGGSGGKRVGVSDERSGERKIKRRNLDIYASQDYD
uniref:uncharacterized protein n=1 Tax=Myxine glutinosa TaxID=7769 RepID=UPI00358EEDF9